MGQHNKALIGLALAQIGCLACGLWIMDEFVVSSARWESQQAAEVDPSPPGDAPSPAEPVLDAEALLASMPLARLLALVWIGGLQVLIAYLVLTRYHLASSKVQQQSTRELLSRDRELLRTRNAVIFGMAKLAEYRDEDTGQHLERIALYCSKLAAAARKDPRFRSRVTPVFARTIGISSVLHDIGKVAIEDAILCKPGKLEHEERLRMQQHTLLAGECIRHIERHLGNSNFLQMARQIALCHHERWDGTGYPHGLAGEEIPLAARLVAIADIYDALSSKRVYKDAYSHQRCVELIRVQAGHHLDPDLVAVFLGIEADFREISQQFADEPDDAECLDPASDNRHAHRKRAVSRSAYNCIFDFDEQPGEPIASAS